MKTIVLSFIMIFGLYATNHGTTVNVSSFIHDLPLADEAYIDDIPFNTCMIASEILAEGDEVRLSEEAYVDDIPFDTKAIACRYLLDKMAASGESNVNDIPFDTKLYYNLCRMEILTQSFRNEDNTMDFPYDTRRIANISFYTFSYPVQIEMPKIGHVPMIEPKNRIILSGFSL